MRPTRKKQKNETLQYEQQQLLKIEKELEDALFKVNDAINVLKVEELQLRSSDVYEKPSPLAIEFKNETKEAPLYFGPSTSFSSKQALSNVANKENLNTETEINQQPIHLDLSTKIMTNENFEEEDEEDLFFH